MKPRSKILTCLTVNFIILVIIISIITVFASDTKYWNIGWNSNLVIISVHINTWYKYFFVLFLIAIINAVKTFVDEFGMPLLGFSIYNPDKKIITQFTKTELQIYGNLMFGVANLRELFLLMANISQVDIAIWGLFIEQVTTIFTIRILLNEKTFEEEKSEIIPQDENEIPLQ